MVLFSSYRAIMIEIVRPTLQHQDLFAHVRVRTTAAVRAAASECAQVRVQRGCSTRKMTSTLQSLRGRGQDRPRWTKITSTKSCKLYSRSNTARLCFLRQSRRGLSRGYELFSTQAQGAVACTHHLVSIIACTS